MRQAGEDWREAGENGADPDPWASQPNDPTRWKRRSDVHRAWGRSSEANRAISAVSTLGRTMVTTRLDRFDADVWKLNVANGTLVFVRGDRQPDGYGVPPSVTLRPHCRDNLITMLAPVDYVPGAAAPIYDAFMAKVQPDATVRRFLHAWGGYCLTGDATEQKFVINHGASGANGKSTWIDAIASLMGDYAIAVNIATFMDEKARSGSSPSPDLAELPHKRLVRTSEPPRGVPFAEALVKLVTGGEPLPARQLMKPFFRYLPEFKITVSMNPVPQLSDDAAIWRRVRVVPWNVSIPEPERDQALPLKLKGEASGILARLVDGLLDWCAGGLPDTAAVIAATQQIRETVDPLGRFLATACTLDPAAKVNSTKLFKVYEAWATWAGEKPWSQNGFSRALANKGFEKHQSSVIYFLGLGLKLDTDDFLDEQGRPWVNVGRGDGLGGDNVARGEG
jgi:putative DNA primase/helicase